MAEFDKVYEGTANTSELPAEGAWLALDADGQALPSDDPIPQVF